MSGHDCCGVYPGHHASCRKARHLARPMAQFSPTEGTARAFCALCDGTGSFPDANHPCPQCNGLGEVVYIPFPIRRKDDVR